MATAQAEVEDPELLEDEQPEGPFKQWMRTNGVWYATSFTAHMVVLLSLGLIAQLLGWGLIAKSEDDAPKFDAAVEEQPKEAELTHFDMGNPPVDPTELNTDSLTAAPEEPAAVEKEYNDDSDTFVERGGGVKAPANSNLGGLGGFSVNQMGPGSKVTGPGGVGGSDGFGKNGGSGGDGSGFGGRGSGHRDAMVGMYGGTKGTERAVAAALDWFKRHQAKDGSWSLKDFSKQCVGAACTGTSQHSSDAAGTAMGLLPFLAAGQTQESKGPYKEVIARGVNWMIAHQKPSGDLSAGAGGNDMMYTHGLATIMMCECYGLSGDSRVRNAAQSAIHFIEVSQDKGGGGWRYQPNEAGDTSVVGWQVMALKSAHMAGLKVDDKVMASAKKYLESASKGKSKYGGLFSYQPGGGADPTMTAVGLLCSQYLGAGRADQGMSEGVAYLMGNMAGKGERNIYYWYYATQVMHNMMGPDWDTWNRQTRKVLVDSQKREGCAQGSWDPAGDHWGGEGGRVMETSLSCLTLEVYYRYLPLYKMDSNKPADMTAAAETK